MTPSPHTTSLVSCGPGLLLPLAWPGTAEMSSAGNLSLLRPLRRIPTFLLLPSTALLLLSFTVFLLTTIDLLPLPSTATLQLPTTTLLLLSTTILLTPALLLLRVSEKEEGLPALTSAPSPRRP